MKFREKWKTTFDVLSLEEPCFQMLFTSLKISFHKYVAKYRVIQRRFKKRKPLQKAFLPPCEKKKGTAMKYAKKKEEIFFERRDIALQQSHIWRPHLFPEQHVFGDVKEPITYALSMLYIELLIDPFFSTLMLLFFLFALLDLPVAHFACNKTLLHPTVATTTSFRTNFRRALSKFIKENIFFLN